jgi:hypothetical protein
MNSTESLVIGTNNRNKVKEAMCLSLMTILGYGFSNGLRNTGYFIPFDSSNLATQVFWHRTPFLFAGICSVIFITITPNKWRTLYALLSVFLISYTISTLLGGDRGWWNNAPSTYYVYFSISGLAMAGFILCGWPLFTYDNIWTKVATYGASSLLAAKVLVVFVKTVWIGLG